MKLAVEMVAVVVADSRSGSTEPGGALQLPALPPQSSSMWLFLFRVSTPKTTPLASPARPAPATARPSVRRVLPGLSRVTATGATATGGAAPFPVTHVSRSSCTSTCVVAPVSTSTCAEK